MSGPILGLDEPLKSVRTRDDFVAFVRALLRDLHENPGVWENTTLETYLEAMAAWVQARDGYDLEYGD